MLENKIENLTEEMKLLGEVMSKLVLVMGVDAPKVRVESEVIIKPKLESSAKKIDDVKVEAVSNGAYASTDSDEVKLKKAHEYLLGHIGKNPKKNHPFAKSILAKHGGSTLTVIQRMGKLDAVVSDLEEEFNNA